MVVGVPCRCMATQPTWRRAATGHSEAETSLISDAPASAAASATAPLVVSTDTRTWPASASTTGITRRNSSSRATGAAPGRVDSPPTSTMSAPSSIIWRPRVMACSCWNQRPPSEKESGVTLRMAITKGRSSRVELGMTTQSKPGCRAPRPGRWAWRDSAAPDELHGLHAGGGVAAEQAADRRGHGGGP